jgi:UDP-glucose 4-epimerase
MRYLLVGGGGFIGSHIVDRLIDKGHEAIVIDNFITGSMKNVEHHIGNSRFTCICSNENPEILERYIPQVDGIFHLAASVGVDYFQANAKYAIRNNIELSSLIFNMAEKYNKRLMFFSTSEVYGNSLNIPFIEDQALRIECPTNMRWGYACSKLMGEFLAMSTDFPLIIVRPFNIVGPRQVSDYGMVIPSFIERAKRNDDLIIYGDGKQIRSFCSIYDAVDAFYLLMLKKDLSGEIFNIGNPKNTINIFDLAVKVKNALWSHSNIVYQNKRNDSDIIRRIPDIRKIQRFTSWCPNITLDMIIEDLK